jgi:predicted DNA binding protein
VSEGASTVRDRIADSLGVASSTIHQHLRQAERRLLAAFVDGPLAGIDRD